MSSSISRIEAAIDGQILEALKDISGRLLQEKIPFFVIGAIARDIVAAKHGGRSTRRTHDLDLAIMVSSEAEFEQVKATLAGAPEYRADPKEEQRMHYEGTIKIDLIPFGPIADGAGQVRLPPSRSFVLNTRGFREAYGASEAVFLEENTSIQVITLESLVLLKLIAWADLPHERERDIEDILFLFREYPKYFPEAQDILYDDRTDLLAANEHDFELACIQLLGLKLKEQIEPDTLGLLTKIIMEKRERLLASTPGSKADFHLDRVEKEWAAFARGLQ